MESRTAIRPASLPDPVVYQLEEDTLIECSDGLDNDGDGFPDCNDFSCFPSCSGDACTPQQAQLKAFCESVLGPAEDDPEPEQLEHLAPDQR